MTTSYKSFQYITPPRTEAKLSPDALPRLEARGWVASIKKNGTRSLVVVHPNRAVIGWNRHGEKHRAWQFGEQTSEIYQKLSGKKFYIFDGELLHNKTHHIKNIHYLYDILVCDGVQLTGTNYEYRFQLLLDVMTPRDMHNKNKNDHYVVDPYTWIARSYHKGFRELFDSLTAKEDEGLVLRNPKGFYYTSKADAWMVKVRRPNITKLY